MTWDQWLAGVPSVIRDERLWNVEAYRLGLFLSDLAWNDVTKLMKDRRTIGLADQLYGAGGSISANLAEGFSRSGGKDRARFYEYALGSAREMRDWYYKGRHVLSDEVTDHRLDLATQVIRLTLTMVPEQRSTAAKR